MIRVAATVAAALALGAALERRFGERAVGWARTGLNVMLYGLVPFVVFFNVARLRFTADVGLGIAVGWVTLLVVGVLAWLAATRLLHLERPSTGAMICAAIQANTAYLGYPVVIVVLGGDALGQAVVYDTLVQAPVLLLVGFGVGAAFGTRAGETLGERARAFLVRNPPLLATLAGLVAPDSLAPGALVSASHVLVFVLLPLGFLAVGVTLASETRAAPSRLPGFDRRIGVTLALRLLVAPGLLALLALPLLHLPLPYLVLAAMPCGINGLVIANAFGLDLRLSAGAVGWSTVLVAGLGAGLSFAL